MHPAVHLNEGKGSSIAEVGAWSHLFIKHNGWKNNG